MMTEHDEQCIRDLGGKVDSLTDKVNDMMTLFKTNLAREESCKAYVAELRWEVFGVDGDPNRPGLKGQMRDVRTAVAGHDGKFLAIEGKYKGGLHWVGYLVAGVICSALTAIFKHYFP